MYILDPIKNVRKNPHYERMEKLIRQPGSAGKQYSNQKGILEREVAVLLENSLEIVEVYLAASKTGLIVIPVHFRFVGQEIINIMENSDAKALIVHEEFIPKDKKCCVNWYSLNEHFTLNKMYHVLGAVL